MGRPRKLGRAALRASIAVVLGALGALAVALGGCVRHTPTPDTLPVDAAGGRAPRGFDRARACADWRSATAGDDSARVHDSFPELDAPRSCFVAVRYRKGDPGPPAVDPIPEGCGYPRPVSGGDPGPARDALLRQAALYASVADAHPEGPLPFELACTLPDNVRRAAAGNNARTLRALADASAKGTRFAYAAVATFGFGESAQSGSPLVSFRPGDACPTLDARELAVLSVNRERAARGAQAYHAGVAPVVTTSGGAIHGTLVEAFMLDYLLTCVHGVPADAVLVDPCADHTHTNLRNTGALVRGIGGRTAYVVTEGIQAGYLEEWTVFDLIGGSIDQRALRDFGYLLGSHRRASVGLDGGFWYTPYRFWAEPEAGLGGFTCVP
jgi:hypothetical protein